MDMAETMIETYYHSGEGYNPFLIRNGWQVAQLNYMPEVEPGNITKVERHLQTDEVFVLLKGLAVLIAAAETAQGFRFTCMAMQPGITYNIPAATWHYIAMEQTAQVFIVERSNTHTEDRLYQLLTPDEKASLAALIKKALHQ